MYRRLQTYTWPCASNKVNELPHAIVATTLPAIETPGIRRGLAATVGTGRVYLVSLVTGNQRDDGGPGLNFWELVWLGVLTAPIQFCSRPLRPPFVV